MKRECDTIESLLGAYADKELGPEDVRKVEQHLDTCADCRRELAQIESLGRLVKSVQHHQLVDDYWDWQRDRVWRGILSADRRQAPSRRPILAWTRLVMPAVSAIVLLVVVFTGWRMLSEKSLLAGKGMVAERGLTQRGESAPAATHEERGPVAEAKSTGAGAVVTEDQTQVAATRSGTGKNEIGYAGRGAGAASARKRYGTERQVAPDSEVAAGEMGNVLASAPATAGSVRASSKNAGRIVSGPVLLQSPPLTDADALDTGTALLAVNTDSNGRVLSATVRRSSGSSRVDSVAVRHMRQSLFQAAVKNNRSVPASFEYPFHIVKKHANSPNQKQTSGKDSTQRPSGNQSAKPNGSQSKPQGQAPTDNTHN